MNLVSLLPVSTSSDNPSSLYDRPGFGSMGFLNRPNTNESMMTLPNTVAGAVTTSEDGSPTINKQHKVGEEYKEYNSSMQMYTIRIVVTSTSLSFCA